MSADLATRCTSQITDLLAGLSPSCNNNGSPWIAGDPISGTAWTGTLPLFSIFDYSGDGVAGTAWHGGVKPVRNASCWLDPAKIDLSGYGVSNSGSGDTDYSPVAIAPDFVVWANHPGFVTNASAPVGVPFACINWQLNALTKVDFLAADGTTIVTRTINTAIRVAGDIVLGILDSPLPSSVAPFKLLPPNWGNYLNPNNSVLLGAVAHTVQNMEVSIEQFSGICITATNPTTYSTGTESYAPLASWHLSEIIGDSSSPWFLVVDPALDNVLVPVLINLTSTSSLGPDTSSQLAAAMNTLYEGQYSSAYTFTNYLPMTNFAPLSSDNAYSNTVPDSPDPTIPFMDAAVPTTMWGNPDGPATLNTQGFSKYGATGGSDSNPTDGTFPLGPGDFRPQDVVDLNNDSPTYTFDVNATCKRVINSVSGGGIATVNRGIFANFIWGDGIQPEGTGGAYKIKAQGAVLSPPAVTAITDSGQTSSGSGGGHLIEVSTSPNPHNLVTGDLVSLANTFTSLGTWSGLWEITVVNSTNFTLNGSTYVGTYSVAPTLTAMYMGKIGGVEDSVSPTNPQAPSYSTVTLVAGGALQIRGPFNGQIFTTGSTASHIWFSGSWTQPPNYVCTIQCGDSTGAILFSGLAVDNYGIFAGAGTAGFFVCGQGIAAGESGSPALYNVGAITAKSAAATCAINTNGNWYLFANASSAVPNALTLAIFSLPQNEVLYGVDTQSADTEVYTSGVMGTYPTTGGGGTNVLLV